MRRLVACVICLLLLAGCPSKEPDAPEPSPNAGEGRVESFDGVPIAYTVAGQSTGGALVLIHGWSCDRSYWTAQVDALSADHRVVTIDLAGHGASGIDRGDWTIAAFGRDVVAVVEALGLDSVVLVGHSMGGPVALEAARLLPGRTVGVIGVDTLHDLEFKWKDGQFEAWIGMYEKDFAGACGEMVSGMFPAGANPELVAEIKGDMCSAPPEVATALLRDFGHLDFAAVATAAGVPIRCINAPAFPTRVEANRKYADYDAYVMEGVGHFPMLERPEEFNELLRRVVEELTSSDTI